MPSGNRIRERLGDAKPRNVAGSKCRPGAAKILRDAGARIDREATYAAQAGCVVEAESGMQVWLEASTESGTRVLVEVRVTGPCKWAPERKRKRKAVRKHGPMRTGDTERVRNPGSRGWARKRPDPGTKERTAGRFGQPEVLRKQGGRTERIERSNSIRTLLPISGPGRRDEAGRRGW